MERFIVSDSPLGVYLEGEGNADNEWTSIKTAPEAPSPRYQSFAPSGSPKPYAKFRRKFPKTLKLEVSTSKSEAVARLHEACSSALHYRLQRAENASFLEQFRYSIVASQLLNQNANPIAYRPSFGGQEPLSTRDAVAQQLDFSWFGLGATVGGAFAVVLSLHWARSFAQRNMGIGGILTLFAGLGIAATILYGLFRRQWLKYLRKQAIESASQLVIEAQRLDAIISATINLIQEVELVSRGYRLSNPLPPISRLEDATQTPQTKRCTRLRKAVRSAFTSTMTPYTSSYATLRLHMIDADFERYCEIYEITLSDLHSFPLPPTLLEGDDLETIKSLKSSFQDLHLIRKLLLCVLLALDADGGAQDFPRWSLAINAMNELSAASNAAATSIDTLLCEEDRAFAVTPKSPMACHTNPQRERTRAQMRKIGLLSQGIRGLQAKMHILREESDRTLAASDDITDAPNLMTQYESIGADLKALMQEWEEGKAHLANSMDTHSRRISASSFGNLGAMISPASTNGRGWHRHSRSSTPSLGGTTVVGGSSPRESLLVPLFGSPRLGASGSVGSPPSLSGASSDEEVFEAVAMPRVRERSELSREERIAKMRDERAEKERRSESAGVKTGMLRELETVIGVKRARSASAAVAAVTVKGADLAEGDHPMNGGMNKPAGKVAGNRLSLPPVGL